MYTSTLNFIHSFSCFIRYEDHQRNSFPFTHHLTPTYTSKPVIFPSTQNKAWVTRTTLHATLPSRASTLRARPLPTKRAKANLIASRASNRAAVLTKRHGTIRRSTSSQKEAAVEVRDYWYRTYTYRYYGYNDTTEVVVELTHIFL